MQHFLFCLNQPILQVVINIGTHDWQVVFFFGVLKQYCRNETSIPAQTDQL